MSKRHLLKVMLAAMLIGMSAAFAADSGPVKGNPDSKVYHQSSCKHYQAKGSTREFKSDAEAVKAGYKPCKRCGKAKADKSTKKK